MRIPSAALLVLALAAGGFAATAQANPCPPQPMHTYVTIVLQAGVYLHDSASASAHFPLFVWDTNVTQDCNPVDGFPVDWDGDYDMGLGTAFFGHGAWADEALCGYDLHAHGPNVEVNDALLGHAVSFLVGADDTSGPAVSTDPLTGATTCEVSGSITPGNPATSPTADADDCLSDTDPSTPAPDPYVGWGATCGAGGDGGYWVMILPPAIVGTVTAWA